MKKINFIVIFSFVLTSLVFMVYLLEDSSNEQKKLLEQMVVQEAKSHYKNISELQIWHDKYGGIFKKVGNSKKSDYKFSIASLNPKNKENIAKGFDKEALIYFEENKTKDIYYEFSEDYKKFNFMGVLKAEQFCLQCHTNYKIGDIRGGIRVHLPIETFNKNINSISKEYKIFEIVSILFGLIFLFVIYILLEKNDKKQKMLKINKAHLARAQKITHIGDWERDIRTDKLIWSKELYRIFGLNKKEIKITYEKFLNSIYKDDLEFLKKEMQNAIKNKEAKTIEFRIVLPNGDVCFIENRYDVTLNKHDELTKLYGTMQDITKRKKIENSLKEKDEIMLAQSRHAAMGEMISMIAHQWRQPLSVISMAANNILADVELDMVENEILQESAEDIVAHAQELSKTIDDFKNFFRPDKKVEEILPQEVFDDAFKVVGKSLENNDIEVVLDFNNNRKFETHSRELMQVFINIIKNAKEVLVEKNIEQRKILISAEDALDEVFIEICDNGGGIDKDIIDKIFEPYFSTKDEKTGTGLGLYMSKTIIEKHLKGKIEVFNKNDGACFRMSLPYIISTKGKLQ